MKKLKIRFTIMLALVVLTTLALANSTSNGEKSTPEVIAPAATQTALAALDTVVADLVKMLMPIETRTNGYRAPAFEAVAMSAPANSPPRMEVVITTRHDDVNFNAANKAPPVIARGSPSEDDSNNGGRSPMENVNSTRVRSNGGTVKATSPRSDQTTRGAPTMSDISTAKAT